MASGVDPSEMNLHARVDDADAELLQVYIDAAEGHVIAHIRRDLNEDFDGDWPKQAQQVVRLLAAHFYTYREANDGGPAISSDVLAMLAPLRDLS